MIIFPFQLFENQKPNPQTPLIQSDAVQPSTMSFLKKSHQRYHLSRSSSPKPMQNDDLSGVVLRVVEKSDKPNILRKKSIRQLPRIPISPTPKVPEPLVYDVCIIGAGPAGLTLAYAVLTSSNQLISDPRQCEFNQIWYQCSYNR
jgi:hypothetical protein